MSAVHIKRVISWLPMVFVSLSQSLPAQSALVRVGKCPAQVAVRNEGKAGVYSFGLVARDTLAGPRLNGVRLASAVPSHTVIVFRPDGRAQFSYCDLFLRNYRQREQALVTQDLHGRASEDLLHLPVGATPPQVLGDAYSLPKGNLYFNDAEDILWWTGDLVYRFDFGYPVTSLRLTSPHGRPTLVGDWEWKKVGRAISIAASVDGEQWLPVWDSAQAGAGGVTEVRAELAKGLVGGRVVFLKFTGQSHNVLFDLYLSGTLDAPSVAPLLRLQRGENRFEYRDDQSSSHHALLFWEGVSDESKRPTEPWPAQPVARRTAEGVVVRFPQKVQVTLGRKGETILGVRNLMVGDRTLLEGPARPLRLHLVDGQTVPLLDDWPAYLLTRDLSLGPGGPASWKPRPAPKVSTLTLNQCRYAGTRRRADCLVAILRWPLPDGQEGTIEWAFTPTTFPTRRNKYTGLRISLRILGLPNAYELSLVEPSWRELGDWVFQQEWSKFDEGRLDFLEPHQSTSFGYFAWGQPLYFRAGAAASAISFFDRPVYAQFQAADDLETYSLNYTIPLRWDGKALTTPEQLWLHSRGDFSSKYRALDEWACVRDAMADHYGKLTGVRPVPVRPTLLWQAYDGAFEEWKASGGTLPVEKRWFDKAAGRLPVLAKAGFGCIYLGCGIWENDAEYPKQRWLTGAASFGSTCTPWHLRISEALGGETGLKHFCDRAHEVGIKVILWSTPAHLSNSSPLMCEHPDWIAWQADGRPLTFGYADITGVSLRRGYLQYALDRYRQVRQQTGFDGVWQDSFLTFGIQTDFAEEHPYPQLDETIAMQRAVQEMGASEIHIEGCGPLGLSSGGYGYGDPKVLDRLRGHEYGLYRFVADSAPDPDVYYRALASGGAVGLVGSIMDFDSKLPAGVLERITQANRDYNTVQPLMVERRLLGEEGVGWMDGSGRLRAVFAFRDAVVPVRRGLAVWDVTTDQPAETGKGSLMTKAWHTYRIERE